MQAADADGVNAPEEQDHDHDGGDLHDAESLVAGFFDALDVLPPVIDGDGGGEDGGGVVYVELVGGVVGVDEGLREPVVIQGDVHHLVHEADYVLAGGDAGDGPGEDVVEHERRNAELGEAAAEGFLDDAVDAAAGKHGTAFDVNGADGEAEEHDAEDEPGGGCADGLFGNAAGIKGGGAQIIQDDGGGTPEGNERQHHGGCHDQPYAVGPGSYDRSRRGHHKCRLNFAGVLSFRGGPNCLRPWRV
jgi:hypothetical protein